MLREIDSYLSVSPADKVPEESKFLLEIDFQSIRTSYWVHAMRAAVRAGQRIASGRRKRRRVMVAHTSTSPAEKVIPLGPDEDSAVIGGGLAGAGFIVHSGSGSIDDNSKAVSCPGRLPKT